jgi:hypothetical protein
VITGVRYAIIDDPVRDRTFKVMYPLALPDNPWGVLLPLKETSWGEQIPVVTGENLSHALHGRPTPLLRTVGPPPRARANRLIMADKLCYEHQCGMCQMAKPECHPGSGELPDCYAAPTEDRDLRNAAVAVAQAWDEQRYVFVVEGPEFLVT